MSGTIHRRSFWLGLGTAVLLVGITGLAWACGPQADMRVQPTSGPAGSEVTVQGAGFPENAPVEVRWEAINGHLLATAHGPDFSMAVTIPEVGEGTYTIVARPVGEAAYDRPTASAAFTVTAAARSSEGDSTAPSGEPEQAAESEQATTEDDQQATGDSTATQEAAPAPAPEQQAAPTTTQDSQPAAEPAPSDQTAQQEPAATQEAAGSDQPADGSATDTADGTVPAEESGAIQADEEPGATGEETADGASAGERYFEGSLPPAQAPARAAESDLWSGLNAEDGAGDAALREEPATAQPDQGLTAGLLLVGLGTAALLGGFLVAQVRRRRLRTVGTGPERPSTG